METRTTEALLALLSEAFPTGDDESRRVLYIDQIRRADIDPRDLTEAVLRIIHVRESRTYPQIAEILRHAKEARVLRLGERNDGPPLLHDEQMVKFGPFQAKEMRVWKKLAIRGVTHCDRAGWMLGETCHCNDRLTERRPGCYGEGVSLPEAEEKLAWAEANREIDPRRAEWQRGVSL